MYNNQYYYSDSVHEYEYVVLQLRQFKTEKEGKEFKKVIESFDPDMVKQPDDTCILILLLHTPENSFLIGMVSFLEDTITRLWVMEEMRKCGVARSMIISLCESNWGVNKAIVPKGYKFVVDLFIDLGFTVVEDTITHTKLELQ